MRAMGLVGDERDAQRWRYWVATSVLTDEEVQGWLRERLDLIRAVPALLVEFEFVRVGPATAVATVSSVRILMAGASRWPGRSLSAPVAAPGRAPARPRRCGW